MSSAAPWFVYLLECRNGHLYTGISTDPERRFREHALGKGARFTRMNPPLRLLAVQACASRSEALRLEHEIKQLRPEVKRSLAAAWAATVPHQPAAPAPDSR